MFEKYKKIKYPDFQATTVRKGKGRGKKTSAVNVLDITPETGKYFVEREEENSDSDATELYEILANMSGPEEEIEMEPPI